MWEDVARHEFEMLLAGPAVALALAWCVFRLLSSTREDAVHRHSFRTCTLLVLLPLLSMLPLASQLKSTVDFNRTHRLLGILPLPRLNAAAAAPDSLERFAEVVRSATTPDSVILDLGYENGLLLQTSYPG